MERYRHQERHKTHRIGWLRAAVLGANDGIVSTASLIVGVAASGTGRQETLIAGIAGLVAGAMSMAAGEYVSVSSQSDIERADIAREKMELETDTEREKHELASIYVNRGLDPELARAVAQQLMERNPLEAHMRDELGITEITGTRPVQAALTSAFTFSIGALIPILIVLALPIGQVVPFVIATSLCLLGFLGALAARAGGAPVAIGAIRVLFWGMFAMALTAGVGALFGNHS